MVTINSRAIKRSLSLFAFVPLIAISRSFLPPFSLFVSHGSLRRSSGLYCLFFKAKNLRRSSLLFCFKKNPPPLVNWAVAPSPSHHGWLFRVNPQSAIKSRNANADFNFFRAVTRTQSLHSSVNSAVPSPVVAV